MNNAVRYQVMPPLSSEEYQELFESIKSDGVLEPIHVDEEGVVIDGHHRSRIAKELSIPCPVITHDDLDEAGKRSLAFTLNLKRRHLNREQRRALIAESLKSDPQLSNREHERRTGTHKNTVAAVREELEESGQIAHFEKRVDPRTGNASQPASHPERGVTATRAEAEARAERLREGIDSLNQESEGIGDAMAGIARLMDPDDLEEINAPWPTDKPTPEPPEPAKPRRTPITDEVWEAILGIKKAITKLTETASDDRFTKNKTQIAELANNDLGLIIESIAEYRNNLK